MPEQTLELSYDTLDDVPEAFRPLFDTDDEGKATFAGVNGMKTQQDVSAVQEALRKEKNDHRTVKEQMAAWKALGDNPQEIEEKLARMEELELASEGKLDEDKIKEIAEARAKQQTGPLNNQIKSLTTERDTLAGEVEQLKASIERRDLYDAIGNVAVEMKAVPTALPDIKIISERYFERDDSGNFITKADMPDVTPGLDVKGFFKEMQRQRPHWFPATEGGGSKGGGFAGDSSDNPWSSKGWSLTGQGQFVKEHGVEMATKAAKAAGFDSPFGNTAPKT